MAIACADPSWAQSQCQPAEHQSFDALYRLTYETLVEVEAKGIDEGKELKDKGTRTAAQIEALKARVNPKCFEELEDEMYKSPLCALRVPVPGLVRNPQGSNSGQGVTVTGDVASYLDATKGGIWIGAANGVFSYSEKNGRIGKIEGDETGGVNEISYQGEWREYGFVGPLIGAKNGLFRYDWTKQSITRIAGDATGSVNAIVDGYVGASNGFFVFDGYGRTARISEETGSVSRIFRGYRVLVGAANGLFRYDWTTRTIARSGGDNTGAITVIADATLIGGPSGLFRYDSNANRAERIPGDETGPITAVFVNKDAREATLIGAQNGLFKYEQNRTTKVTGDETGRVSLLADTAKGLLVGSPGGLYRYDKDRVLKVAGGDTGSVKKIYSLGPGYSNVPLIVADNGLFLLLDSGTVSMMPNPNSDVSIHLNKNDYPLIVLSGRFFYLNILPKTYAEGIAGFQPDGCFAR